MKIEYVCKLCHQPREFYILDTDSCQLDQMIKLQKLLVCNPCADLRNKFKTAEETIFRSCVSLERITLLRCDGDEAGKIREKCRTALLYATKKYAEALAVYRSLDSVMWHEDFVDLLMSGPSQVVDILKRYRDGLRTMRQTTLT